MTTADLIATLPRTARRGSKPRCHLLTHGPRAEVAARLTRLMQGWGTVSPDDYWMPDGFDQMAEAELHKAHRLLDPEMCDTLGRWWLPHDRLDARTPNWDIAATCTIEGRRGLLLVEAKAHNEELLKEAAGRKLLTREKGDQEARTASHATIGVALGQAREGLAAATTMPWGIGLDSHYQLSNRFAWSWKVAQLGVPVVLIYLGLLDATEMKDRGKPFASVEEWDTLVRGHSEGIVPEAAWGNRLDLTGTPLIPGIVGLSQALTG